MARSKTGGRIGWILFAIFAFVFAKAFMSDGSESEEATDESEVAVADAQPRGIYSESPQRDDWPPLSEGSEAAGGAPAATSNYYVVLDGSGSMSRVDCSDDKPKIDIAVAALSRFVSAVPAQANLGLAVFDDAGLSERVPLGVGNREAFQQALRQVDVSGGTPLKSSIELAYEQLTVQAHQQLGYGDYHLVLVTDGYPDPRSEDPTDAVQGLLTDSSVILHTIGFCLGQDHVLNQPGRVYYMAADSPQQLSQGLGEVLAEAPSFDVTQFQGQSQEKTAQ
jgi:uncharacterized protein YegL